MKKIKNQTGITLIALIITIIVMLILVAVTISVAMQGGIFNNAKEAKDKTKRETDREELIATMVGAYNSSGAFDINLVGTLPSEARWCDEDTENYSNTLNTNPAEGDWTGGWIITKGNNKFYIDEYGSVLDEKPETIETPDSEWWFNHGLTSNKVKYNQSYKGNNSDEIIINSEAGFTKYVENGNTREMGFLTNEAYNSYWNGLFGANDNVFYWMNGGEGAVHICYFNGNILNLYKITDVNILNSVVTGGYSVIENFLPENNEPLEIFVIQ